MPRIIRRPAALRDLTRHFAYLTEHAGQATAERFLQAAERTFGDLATTPLLGTPDKVRQGRFAGVRLWRVRGFGTKRPTGGLGKCQSVFTAQRVGPLRRRCPV